MAKRGLPYVHILLWLENQVLSDMIDKFVCAEILYENCTR